jgi:cytoskeleton protein RodZ
MQTIGERLEEARKQQGVSLREASEATKVRSDFLEYFEQNRFDFELPEVYKRGFIKNYARYLKLDPEKVITDYNSFRLGSIRQTKKGGGEWFGQMEIKKEDRDETPPVSSSKTDGSYGMFGAKTTESVPEATDSPPKRIDKDHYIKMGLVLLGALTFAFVVFGIISAVLKSDDTISPGISEEPVSEATVDAARGVQKSDSIRLIASGTVYVRVKQRKGDIIIFDGTLEAGHDVPLKKSGPVDVLFTAGENLVIVHNGEKLRPGGSGTAKMTVE